MVSPLAGPGIDDRILLPALLRTQSLGRIPFFQPRSLSDSVLISLLGQCDLYVSFE